MGGPKKVNKQEKAAKRRAKNSARKTKGQNGNAEVEDAEDYEFDDDVPKMKIQLEKLGLELKEVEGDG